MLGAHERMEDMALRRAWGINEDAVVAFFAQREQVNGARRRGVDAQHIHETLLKERGR